MNSYAADLHIHTVLSPCGDLDMSPGRIVNEAAAKGLDIIGITDHNSTLHCLLTEKLAAQKGILVMKGAEVTTAEEVHCLAFFEDNNTLTEFQKFIDSKLPEIKNNPEIFGYQVVVDENETILFHEERLLITALKCSFEEAEIAVHKLGGIFITAHTDKGKNSIYSQLGMLPPLMKADALEISKNTSSHAFSSAHRETSEYTLIQSSDAHIPDEIGTAKTWFKLETLAFNEIQMALAGINGRRTFIK